MKQYQVKKFFSGFFLVCSLFGCKKCISGSENMKIPRKLSNALCKSTDRPVAWFPGVQNRREKDRLDHCPGCTPSSPGIGSVSGKDGAHPGSGCFLSFSANSGRADLLF